jgi:hypothetical protein
VKTPDTFGIRIIIIHVIIVYDVCLIIFRRDIQRIFTGIFNVFEVICLYFGIPVGFLVGINVIFKGFGTIRIFTGFTDYQYIIGRFFGCTNFREGFIRCNKRGIAWPVIQVVGITARHLKACAARRSYQGDDA